MWISQPPQENLNDAFADYLADVIAHPAQYPGYANVVRAAANLGPALQAQVRQNLEDQMRVDFLQAVAWRDAYVAAYGAPESGATASASATPPATSSPEPAPAAEVTVEATPPAAEVTEPEATPTEGGTETPAPGT